MPAARPRRTLFVVGAILASASVAGCGRDPAAARAEQGVDEPRGATTRNGLFYVSYRTSPSPIPDDTMFKMIVEIRDPVDPDRTLDGAALRVDGRMPQHAHGMNMVPRVTTLGRGRFAVEGMLFHMPGEWQMLIDVIHGEDKDRAIFDIVVP